MYIGPKSRTERPRKTKIGTEVAHVTCVSNTTLKVKGQLTVGGAYCGGLLHSLLLLELVRCKQYFASISNSLLVGKPAAEGKECEGYLQDWKIIREEKIAEGNSWDS